MDGALTQVYPQARVIAYADDGRCCMRTVVLEHCQQLLMTWLAAMGLTLNEAKSRIHHTLEGEQPGFDFGFTSGSIGVGKHHSGRHASAIAWGIKP